MKRLILVAALLAIAAWVPFPQVASAREVDVTYLGRTENVTQKTYTDFHLEVTSDSKLKDCKAILQVEGDGKSPPTAMSGNNTRHVTLLWYPLPAPVGPGQAVVVGIYCKQDVRNEIVPIVSKFTPENSPTDVPGLGWWVTPSGRVYLENGLPEDVDFDDLRFQFPSAMSLDSMSDLVANPATGVLAPVSSGTVSAGGRMFVGQVSLNEGDFLTARAETSFADSGYSSLEATNGLGHEHQSSVGGTAELLVGGSDAPASAADPSDSSDAPGSATDPSGGASLPYAALAGAAAAFAVAAGGWYVRRRWIR